jgi:hypothetical protein
MSKQVNDSKGKVILARKLARIAFTLMNKQQMFIKQAIPVA